MPEERSTTETAVERVGLCDYDWGPDLDDEGAEAVIEYTPGDFLLRFTLSVKTSQWIHANISLCLSAECAQDLAERLTKCARLAREAGEAEEAGNQRLTGTKA